MADPVQSALQLLQAGGAAPQPPSAAPPADPVESALAQLRNPSAAPEQQKSTPKQQKPMQKFIADKTMSLPGSAGVMEALANVPHSGWEFAKGAANAVLHPIDTARTVLDAAAGGLRNITPAPISNAIDAIDPNPQAAQRATDVANAVGNVYKGRYGSLEAAGKTLTQDPVGAAADLSAVTGMSSLLAPGRAGAALNQVSQWTNPVRPAVPVLKAAANVGGELGAQGLGLSTGLGPEAIKTAFQSGKEGATNFWSNMTGAAPMRQVVDDAKAALGEMKAQRSAQYRSGMVDISADKAQLDYGKIDAAISEAKKVGAYKGEVVNSRAAEAVGKVEKTFEEWMRLDPKEFHTPEGFDALKQKIGSILESIPYEEKTARLAVGKIYSATKSAISEQAPTYSKVMKDYSSASELLEEMERTLSMRGNAPIDATLRKLQSVLRNNVNTNYGNRLDLVKTLEDKGGASLMPSLAGQSMTSWTPRGLGALLGSGELAGSLGSALLGHPGAGAAILAALPMQSPRIVGTGLYGAGKVAGAIPGVPPALVPPALLVQRAGALYSQ